MGAGSWEQERCMAVYDGKKKKDTEEEDETTFLSRSLRPTFVEILAERLRDAEADLQGEIEVRV